MLESAAPNHLSKNAPKTLDNYQVQFYMFGTATVIFTAMFAFNGRFKALFSIPRKKRLSGDLLAVGGALSWALFSGLGKKNWVDEDLSIYVYTLAAFVLSAIGLAGFSTFKVPDITGMGMAEWLGNNNILLGNLL